MASNKDFELFIKDINPSKSTIEEVSRLHQNLRSYLTSDENYSNICNDTYLSGSYAKQTFIRPKTDSDGCDIDIIVETCHSTEFSPYDTLVELKNTITKRSCYQNTRLQSHSVGIEMARFHIDVVPLATDNAGNLYIGTKDNNTWKPTNPKEHIAWATKVNKDFDNNFKPLAKIMKWWRRENCPATTKFPKGITLEKMIADNLPELGLPIMDQVMQVMTNLSSAYTETMSSLEVPFIEDPVLSGNNLAAKYNQSDFAQFIAKLNEHLEILANEGTDNEAWKKILGSNFPSSNSTNHSISQFNKHDQEKALAVSHKQKPNFPIQSRKPNAVITATATLPSGEIRELSNDDAALPKKTKITYRVNCSPIKNGTVRWQVTNTGEEAMLVCPRGGFEPPNEGKTSRYEETAYTGKHYVQCFILQKGYCVRWAKPFFINVE